MICKGCNTEIADKALICYRCGRATVEPRITPPSEGSIFDKPGRSPWPVIAAVVAAAAAAAAWFLLQ